MSERDSLAIPIIGTTFKFDEVVDVLGNPVKGLDSYSGELGPYSKLLAVLDEFQFQRPSRPLEVVRHGGSLLRHLHVSFFLSHSAPCQYVEHTESPTGVVASGTFDQWKRQIVEWLTRDYDSGVRSLARQCHMFFVDVGLEMLFSDYEWTCDGKLQCR